jgi:hypothetical protein
MPDRKGIVPTAPRPTELKPGVTEQEHDHDQENASTWKQPKRCGLDIGRDGKGAGTTWAWLCRIPRGPKRASGGGVARSKLQPAPRKWLEARQLQCVYEL